MERHYRHAQRYRERSATRSADRWISAGHPLDDLPAETVKEGSLRGSGSAPSVAILQITDMEQNKDDAWSAIIDLYHKRLPADERYPNGVLFNLIRDHLRGDFGPRRISAYWKAYFMVAKFGQQVVGMLLGYNYDDSQSDFVYIPYLVVAKGLPREADPRTIGRKLIDNLVSIRMAEKNGNRICFIAEVDDPATTEDRKEKCRRRARIELFDTISHIAHFELRCLDFKFIQPKLAPSDIGAEEELLILYGAKISRKFLAREEVVRILTWFYKQLYSANMFTDPEEDDEYQHYLDRLLDKATNAIPDQVRLKKLEPFYRGPGAEGDNGENAEI